MNDQKYGEEIVSGEVDVDAIVDRARIAQRKFESGADQSRYDIAAQAVGWALMAPSHNAELSHMAVETTGFGNVEDKISKNYRKTLGLLRDIRDVTTYGLISDDPMTGITEIARPIGVVGAVVPSTNPVATPTNNVINALKCGNSIILSPSPKGAEVCKRLLDYIYAEFDKINLDHDLVQMLPFPVNKMQSQRLMQLVDMLVVTGSHNNVHRAYSSGTPAIGVGVGNVTVIIDDTADIYDAAQKIAISKCFDHSTSCSSENALVILDSIYDSCVAALRDVGGYLLNGNNAKKLKSALFRNGTLNRDMIACDIGQVMEVAGIDSDDMEGVGFLLIEGEGIGSDYPESGEKLSLVATVYRARDFANAKDISLRILQYQGAGHSIGIHTTDQTRPYMLGIEMPVCRVIVNQAHCFATGGSFDNGMPFSLSMGCGSWGGNIIDDNFHYKHMMNITKIVHQIPSNEPSVEDIFGDYWRKFGK